MPFDERKCRICGCTDNCACPGGCYWVEEDLCSRCVEKAEMDKNYKCIYCGGTGELEVHGPGETYTRTCRDCRGTGEKLIEITLKEYDKLIIKEKKQMNDEQTRAYEWAKNQNFQSVAARYAKILASAIDEILEIK